MDRVSRRKLMKMVAVAGSGAALTTLVKTEQVNAEEIARMTTEEQAATVIPAARAFGGQHSPKPLPFDPTKLKGISEKLIKSHWENNYGGVKREELVRTGSVVLHEHYFANLGGDGKVSGKALDLIKQWFGSYEQWEAEFKKTANALGGGSGWTILSYNLHTGEVHNYWAWDHMHNAPMGYPLLVLDLYEHAYHMDYGAAAAKYVDAFMQNVNWDEVNRRVEEVRVRK